MPGHRILLVDDDAELRRALRGLLESYGHRVFEAATFDDALGLVEQELPDAAIFDLMLEQGDVLDVLPEFVERYPEVPCVVLTGSATIERAVRSIQAGAKDFLTKPVHPTALLRVVQRLVEEQRLRRHRAASQARGTRSETDPFLGGSAAIRALEAAAREALATESPVLVTGETGTGKGVLAAWLHRHGARAGEEYVDVNCAGLSRELLDSELFGHERGAFTGAVASKPGLLEAAHRGTLFLDEIGDMDLAVQGKLLKVLEDKRYRRVGDTRERKADVRIIAATHRDLKALVREGRFREDFYYRLEVIPLHVPPLRERPGDVPALAQRLLERLAAELGRGRASLAEDAMNALERHPWPGNVRELRNVLERALLRSETGDLGAAALRLGAEPARAVTPSPSPAHGGGPLMSLAEVERRHIEAVLDFEAGNVERAARRLGVPRSTLYQRLRAFGIRGRA